MISRLRGARGVSLAVVASFALAVACSTKQRDFDNSSPITSFDPDASADASNTGCVSLQCSRDLKKVLCLHADGTEEVAQECGSDLGCGDGKCVEPCTAAELAKGTIGCSFATLPSDLGLWGASGSCFAAMIANTWDRPATVSATLGAEPLDIGPATYYVDRSGAAPKYTHVDGAIAPGKVAIVFLSNGPDTTNAIASSHTDCPRAVTPAFIGDPISHGTSRTRAFLLQADTPVSAYSIFPYGGAGSFFPAATVLLPRSSWETNYVAVSGWPDNYLYNGDRSSQGSSTLQIVAAEDDTEVSIRPSVGLEAGVGVDGASPGISHTYTLARGEVLQFTQPADASGSPVQSNKPIGLFGGSDCVYIPNSFPACDTLQQQIAPVSQWGSEYAIVPYRPRSGDGVAMTDVREKVPYRLVGAADGTKLTYDPSPAPLGAPATLEAGQYVTFSTTYTGTVSSQDAAHPFHLSMFMTGASDPSVGGMGDPDFVAAVPSQQFLDHYIFFTDFTYPDTTLTVVRRATDKGFQPVTLDCAGEVPDFRPLGRSGQYEFAWMRLVANNKPQSFAGGTCDNGRHEARSDGPFGVYVFGTGPYASYGYPGGAGLRPLTDVKLNVF